jgi:hypothetical protein
LYHKAAKTDMITPANPKTAKYKSTFIGTSETSFPFGAVGFVDGVEIGVATGIGVGSPVANGVGAAVVPGAGVGVTCGIALKTAKALLLLVIDKVVEAL